MTGGKAYAGTRSLLSDAPSEAAVLSGGTTAYAATLTVLLAFIFKFAHFKEVMRFCSLTATQTPRRNLYAPLLLPSQAQLYYTFSFRKNQ